MYRYHIAISRELQHLSEQLQMILLLTRELHNILQQTSTLNMRTRSTEHHYIKVLVGYNYEQSTYNRLATQRNGIIYEDATDMNLALGQAIVTGGGYEKWQFLVVFQGSTILLKTGILLRSMPAMTVLQNSLPIRDMHSSPQYQADGVSQRSHSGMYHQKSFPI